MASLGVQKLAFLTLLVLVVLTCNHLHEHVQAAITCDNVATNLMPCLSFVQGGPLQPGCCNGIKTLLTEAQTITDRQNVCKCLKQAAQAVSNSGTALDRAKSLPNKCAIRVPYEISPSTQCNQVQ